MKFKKRKYNPEKKHDKSLDELVWGNDTKKKPEDKKNHGERLNDAS